MKTLFYTSLLLYCIVSHVACTGPVIIDEEAQTEITEGEQNEDSQERDSVLIVHEGTYASPYSIGEAQTLGRGNDVWIEGYIVGCVLHSMKSGCNYTAQATTLSNILLADTIPTGSEDDYLYCLPVELPNGSIERDDLNLYDNPENYHRKLRIQGDITLYYKVAGMKKITDYIFCDTNDNDEAEEEGNDDKDDDTENDVEDGEPESPDIPNDPDKTFGDTLSIIDGIKLQSENDYNQVYIKGYIIGYTTSNRKIYYDFNDMKVTSARSNVILADNIEERDYHRMIAVELKNGSYIQEAVNLYDNPQNLHRRLTVKGVMKTHKSLNGCIEIPNGYTHPGDTVVDKDYYFSIE